MEIRVLGADEWPIWRELRLRALADAPDAYGRTLEGALAMSDDEWRAHLLSDSVTFVAEIEGRPIGTAVARIDGDDPTVAALFAMWVDPVARRTGVAKALVSSVDGWARERGATEIELAVSVGNRPAETLYGSIGFTETGHREPLREGSDLETVHMRRPVAR